MKQEDSTFIWKFCEPSMIFPIDYTANEYGQEFQQDARIFRNEVLRHPFFQDTLLDLYAPDSAKASDGKRYHTGVSTSQKMPPIPLEAIPLLNCFYQLVMKPKAGYRRAIRHPGNAQPDNITHFVDELFEMLYNETAPPKDGKENRYAYCRHICFQNKRFTSVMLNDVWKQEVIPRYQKIQELAKQVSREQQMAALKDCLISLDRTILNLQSQIRAAPPEPHTDDTPNQGINQKPELQQLLTDLISKRTEKKGRLNGQVAYKLPNLRLNDATTLKEAFQRFGTRTGRPTNSVKALMDSARQTYLAHLAKTVEDCEDEATKEALAFEREYIALQNYLDILSPQGSGDVAGIIKESCKLHCQYILAYCTYSPPPAVSETVPVPEHHKDALLNVLIAGYMNDITGIFRDMIQCIAYYCAGESSTLYYRIYEQTMWAMLKHCIKDFKSDPTIEPFASKLEELVDAPSILPIPPEMVDRNIFYQDAVRFSEFFTSAWEFLYGKPAQPIFDEQTRCFHDPGTIAAKLLEDGTVAATFFENEKLAFPNEEVVQSAIAAYDKIVTNPDGLCPPSLFWNSIPKMLQVLLLQSLKKVVEDSVSRLVEYVRPQATTA